MNHHCLSHFYRIVLQFLLYFVISITAAMPLAHGQSRLRKAIDAGVDDKLSSRIRELDSYELISRSDAQNEHSTLSNSRSTLATEDDTLVVQES